MGKKRKRSRTAPGAQGGRNVPKKCKENADSRGRESTTDQSFSRPNGHLNFEGEWTLEITQGPPFQPPKKITPESKQAGGVGGPCDGSEIGQTNGKGGKEKEKDKTGELTNRRGSTTEGKSPEEGGRASEREGRTGGVPIENGKSTEEERHLPKENEDDEPSRKGGGSDVPQGMAVKNQGTVQGADKHHGIEVQARRRRGKGRPFGSENL